MSRDEAACALGCGKATVAKCAAKMEDERIGAERLESMTDAEVSCIFDGRGKRGEERPGRGCGRVCDQLVRVPKTALGAAVTYNFLRTLTAE